MSYSIALRDVVFQVLHENLGCWPIRFGSPADCSCRSQHSIFNCHRIFLNELCSCLIRRPEFGNALKAAVLDVLALLPGSSWLTTSGTLYVYRTKNEDAPEFVTSTGEYGAQIRRLLVSPYSVMSMRQHFRFWGNIVL